MAENHDPEVSQAPVEVGSIGERIAIVQELQQEQDSEQAGGEQAQDALVEKNGERDTTEADADKNEDLNQAPIPIDFVTLGMFIIGEQSTQFRPQSLVIPLIYPSPLLFSLARSLSSPIRMLKSDATASPRLKC